MTERTPPPRTPAQQQEHERMHALVTLDIPAMRAWAARYAVGLLGTDRTVLISMHETRVIDKRIPARLREQSIAWLKTEYPASTALAQVRQFPGAFRGPSYGKAKGGTDGTGR